MRSAAAYWLRGRAHAPGLFPAEAGPLYVDGTTFRRSDGSLFQWRGYSLFTAYHDFRLGVDLRPRLRRLRTKGVNIIRVFGALPWLEREDAWVENFSRDQLPDFFRLTSAEGFRVEYVPECYQFREKVRGDKNTRIYRLRPEQRRDLQETYDISAQFPLVLVEGANEPHVNHIDIVDLMGGINRHDVVSAYGVYDFFYDSRKPVAAIDYLGLHSERDSAWHRKARHVQELQARMRKPAVGGEPAKIAEPGFIYPGAKTNAALTPAEAVWHFGILGLYVSGGHFHCEAGKWGDVPEDGTLQAITLDAVRDNVWTRIDADVQTGDYSGAHMGKCPVDGKDLQIDGQDIWTYASTHADRALAVRCAFSAPKAKPGWKEVEAWGPGHSIVRLERR